MQTDEMFLIWAIRYSNCHHHSKPFVQYIDYSYDLLGGAGLSWWSVCSISAH